MGVLIADNNVRPKGGRFGFRSWGISVSRANLRPQALMPLRSRAVASVAAICLLAVAGATGCSNEQETAKATTTTSPRKETTATTDKAKTTKPTSTAVAAAAASIPTDFCAGFSAIDNPKLTSDERSALMTDLVAKREALLKAVPAEIRDSLSIVIDAAAVAIGKPETVRDIDSLTEKTIAPAEEAVIEYRKDHC